MSKIIEEVEKLIAEGKEEELEKAIRKIQNNTEDFSDENELLDDEYYEEEYEEDFDDEYEVEEGIITHISGTIENIMQYTEGMPIPLIPIIPTPTAYGIGLLIKTENVVSDINDFTEKLIKENIGCIPVEIKFVRDEENIIAEMLYYNSDMKNRITDLMLIYPLNEENKNPTANEMIIPVNGFYSGMGCMAQDFNDMLNAIKTLLSAPKISDDTFVFPETRFEGEIVEL